MYSYAGTSTDTNNFEIIAGTPSNSLVCDNPHFGYHAVLRSGAGYYDVAYIVAYPSLLFDESIDPNTILLRAGNSSQVVRRHYYPLFTETIDTSVQCGHSEPR